MYGILRMHRREHAYLKRVRRTGDWTHLLLSVPFLVNKFRKSRSKLRERAHYAYLSLGSTIFAKLQNERFPLQI